MLISTFIGICKDFFMLILSVISVSINSLFQMNLFWDGSTYIISVGHICLALIIFSIIFGFILNAIKQHFGGGE